MKGKFIMNKLANPNIFSSYVYSGRRWPQKRWANVIVLLNYLGKSNKDLVIRNPELKSFFSYRLSSSEIAMLRNIMNSDHTNAGISIRFVNDNILECEFIKTQIGVKKVIDAFLNDTTPEYFKHKDLNDIKNEYEKLQYFNTYITMEQGRLLYNVFNTCELELKKHKNLSKLFRITYYHVDIQTQLINTPEYMNILKSYNINSFKKDNLEEIRAQITQIMFNYITTAVNEKFPNIKTFFIYDK